MVLQSNIFRKFLSHLCAILSMSCESAHSSTILDPISSATPTSAQQGHAMRPLVQASCPDGECIGCPDKITLLASIFRKLRRVTPSTGNCIPTHKIPSELEQKSINQASAMLMHLKDAPGKGCRKFPSQHLRCHGAEPHCAGSHWQQHCGIEVDAISLTPFYNGRVTQQVYQR
jgi:hypothetical protein